MKDKYIYALGVFDGVHLGHQALLKACRELAEQAGCKAGVVTFSPHPEALLTGKDRSLLNTQADKKRLLYAYGADKVVVLPFDRELMRTPWAAFLEQLLTQGAAGFVCGSDFRFGAQGAGTAQQLKEFCESRGLYCKVAAQQMLDKVRVSSTHIRKKIEEGKMEDAARFLGHPHILTGTVVKGNCLGRTIGVPTANLRLPPELLCPKLGVYACKVRVGQAQYLAVTNIGTRPTVGGSDVTVEPWILDFEGELYGKEITLLFYQYLRPEQKFGSLEELKKEIQKNACQTRKILENP